MKGTGTGGLCEFAVSSTLSSPAPDLTGVRAELLAADGERSNSPDIFHVWNTMFLLNEGTGGS